MLFAGDTGKQAVTKKHVLVMDEVDGMAGNEDRGKELPFLILTKGVIQKSWQLITCKGTVFKNIDQTFVLVELLNFC